MLQEYAYMDFYFFAILGLCIGSFLNVVIYRLPIILCNKWEYTTKNIENKISPSTYNKLATYNLCMPASSCCYCTKKIPIWYKIPVFSWAYLRGRSNCCKNKISWRYCFIELFTCLITVNIKLKYNDLWMQCSALILIYTLVALAFIDFDKKILPDCITFPLIWGGLLVNVKGVFSSLEAAIIGASIGYLFLWGVYWSVKLLTKKEGMGYGDFKLMAALGAWFGWQSIPLLVFSSSFLGIISYSFFLFFNKQETKTFAFGPYLSLSGIIFIFIYR